MMAHSNKNKLNRREFLKQSEQYKMRLTLGQTGAKEK
jgi:hypothetical protein